MDFGGVVRALKADPCIKFYRRGWGRFGEYVSLRTPDEHSLMTSPFLYISGFEGTRPWVPSFDDMFAEDWYQWAEPVTHTGVMD